MNKKLVFASIMIASLFAISSCDLKSKKAPESITKNNIDIVRIGRLICGGHLPLAIVEQKFQAQINTFQLKTVQNHDWNQVVADMQSGKLMGTFILSPLAMEMIRKGFLGKIVLMADRNGNGFVLSKKIKSIAELKNQQSIIAVPHIYSQHHVLLHMLLKQNDIPETNIKVLGMAPRDMINSLRNGEIDGFMVGEPESNKSVSLGVGWMAAISPKIWKNHMDHVFLASNSFIKQQPKKLQQLINQLVRAGKYIENNPHEAAIMGENYTGSAAAIFEQVLTTPDDWISYADMIVNEQDMISMAEKLVEMNLWQKVPKNLMNEYFDMSFVKKTEQNLQRK